MKIELETLLVMMILIISQEQFIVKHVHTYCKLFAKYTYLFITMHHKLQSYCILTFRNHNQNIFPTTKKYLT